MFHVDPVLDDIQIEGAEVDGAKIVDRVVDGVQGIVVVRFPDTVDEPRKP